MKMLNNTEANITLPWPLEDILNLAKVIQPTLAGDKQLTWYSSVSVIYVKNGDTWQGFV